MEELGLVDYRHALALQRKFAADRRAGGPDRLLLLEHPSIYTAGRRTEPHERPADPNSVVDVDRGGKITWHGPGQLVGYPIIELSSGTNAVTYIRRLEQALLHVCDLLGLGSVRRIEGRSGVWLPATPTKPARKLAALGIHLSHNITTHGFAINCNPDLTAFDKIVPCGIADATVTSLSAELHRPVTVAYAIPIVRNAILTALGDTPLT